MAGNDSEIEGDYIWAPGTVLLEEERNGSKALVFHPIPTDDPNDPLNWSMIRKMINLGLACLYVLSTFVLLDIGSVAYEPYTDMGFSYTDLNNATALNYTGLAVGCFLFIPFVFKFGRRPVYLLSTTIQFASALWAAWATTPGQYMAVMLLAGLSGAVSETIVQITIADLFFVHQRGAANGLFIAMESVGSFVSPVVAGYIIVDQGWQWIWWWTSVLLAVNLLLTSVFYEETKYIPHIASYPPISLLRNEEIQPDQSIQDSKKDLKLSAPSTAVTSAAEQREEFATVQWGKKSYRQRLAFVTPSEEPLFRHAWNPLILLFTFPAVAFTGLTYGFLLVWVSVLGTVQSLYLLYPPYNFNSAQIGLFNLSGLVGGIIGSMIGGPLSDWLAIKASRRNNGIYEPEYRLYLGTPSAFLCAAGLLLFGFELEQGASWLVLAVSTAMYCTGLGLGSDIALVYLTDCYKDIIGDAFVAVAFVRNVISVIIMFVITPWIDGMGIQNTFILCGALAFVSLNVCIPMIIFGKKARIRTAEQYKYYSRLNSLSRDRHQETGEETNGVINGSR